MDDEHYSTMFTCMRKVALTRLGYQGGHKNVPLGSPTVGSVLHPRPQLLRRSPAQLSRAEALLPSTRHAE